jgi:hypothetical protein
MVLFAILVITASIHTFGAAPWTLLFRFAPAAIKVGLFRAELFYYNRDVISEVDSMKESMALDCKSLAHLMKQHCNMVSVIVTNYVYPKE